MYELQGTPTGAALSSQYTGTQSITIYDRDDRKSEAPKVLIVVLSVVLMFAFVAVLAVLLIGSSGGDETTKGTGGNGRSGDRSEAGIDRGHIPSYPLIVEVPMGPRVQPSVVTATPARDPSTAQTVLPTHPPGLQTCPGGGYYGRLIGRFTTYGHAVSGIVYAASEDSIVIKGLNYDGTENDAQFWAQYKPFSTVTAGHQIPDENGSYDYLKAYTNATVYLKLPKKITAFQNIGIYKELNYEPLGNVYIQRNYELPKEKNLGQLKSRFGDVAAKEVVLTDSSSMRLKGFLNDGHCPNAYFVAASTTPPHPEELTYLTYDGNKTGKLGSYNNTDVAINLPEGCHWNQFKLFSVFCMDAVSSISDIDIDRGAAERLPLHTPESAVHPIKRNGLPSARFKA